MLVADDAPTFSLYRMDFTGDDGRPQRTTGVIGALGLGHEPGEVMPHERTLPKAKSDRLELLRATRANLDPIWGLSLATGLSTRLAQAHADLPDPPFATATDEDGFHHSLWRITDPHRLARHRATRSPAPAWCWPTVTTGSRPPQLPRRAPGRGHRRSRRRRDHDAGRGARPRAAVRAGHPPPARAASAPSTSAPRSAGPFRVDAAGPNAPEGVAALETAMRESGGLGLVDRDGLALLLPNPSSKRAWTRSPPSCATSTRHASTPECSPRSPGSRSPTATTPPPSPRQVEKGDADAAVLLRPVTVDTIRAAAAADLRMPEKTTFFAPKPRTGMVFRSLD